MFCKKKKKTISTNVFLSIRIIFSSNNYSFTLKGLILKSYNIARMIVIYSSSSSSNSIILKLISPILHARNIFNISIMEFMIYY